MTPDKLFEYLIVLTAYFGVVLAAVFITAACIVEGNDNFGEMAVGHYHDGVVW